MKQFVKIILIAGLGLSLTYLAGCGTMAGIGKDVKSAGKTIENGAEQP
ncbi:MAG: entericidin A/B family lipoprotein [Thiotrichaceae bacterium]|jgi:predicted small secreted protein|nr:entericidin A/B family lipoprotein [Thiotrichaceae bacterium]